MTISARRKSHSEASAALAGLDDHALRDLVDATPTRAGIGGQTHVLRLGDVSTFVKRIPLTRRELRPENHRSTANLFGLPTFCHYGIGSPGFGAWRELAVHEETTAWVLTDRRRSFPLLYGWRVLPASGPPSTADELGDLDALVHFWDDSPAVRDRLTQMRSAPASLVLFLEYVPQMLGTWLQEQVTADDETAGRASRWADDQLRSGTAFMNNEGLLHFDAHFDNVMTDGQDLYFGDFGLALSSRFELDAEERRFFDRHRTYDHTYTTTFLARWLGRSYADRPGTPMPAAVADLIGRHAGITTIMEPFYQQLQHVSRSTPYPVDALERVL